MKLSTAVRDAMNNAFEATTGASPTLEIRTGVPPANCAAADTGTLIASGALPADWMAASASGVVSKSGAWTVTGTAGAGAGTAGGHYRIKQGATCHAQGTFGAGQEMIPDNNSIATGQVATINTFSYTHGDA